MSFRINTNTTAQNALRNLNQTSEMFQNSITRLSTGLRINSGADDPAGLVASETFRAQIGGIDQAIRNSQDAGNYAKTAEGALGEMSKLLNDARALAVASGNDASLTDTQRQANNAQLQSIINSITRISTDTAFGTKKLLDGSAGTYASSTSSTNVSGMRFSGNFNGSAVTTSSTVTINVTTAATKAIVTAGMRTFAQLTTTIGTGAGSFTLNGVSFSASSTDTIQDVVARINNATNQTGVVATFTAGGIVTLTSANYGTNAKVDLVDSSGVLQTTAGSRSSAGVNAVVDVTIDANGSTAGGLATVTFDKGQGLEVRDLYGNGLTLTANGNLLGAATAVGQLNVGQSIFQIGGNANQTTSFSLGNFGASSLGQNVVTGKDVSNITLDNATNSTDALKVIDKAITDISSARGTIGNFQRNILESNIRSLGIARENLSAADSLIRDVDIAAEMTLFTRSQILQQSGMAMLAQANSSPQSVLSLLQ